MTCRANPWGLSPHCLPLRAPEGVRTFNQVYIVNCDTLRGAAGGPTGSPSRPPPLSSLSKATFERGSKRVNGEQGHEPAETGTPNKRAWVPLRVPTRPLAVCLGGGRGLASLGPSRLGPPCLRRARLGTSVSRPGPLAVCVAVLAGHSGDPVRPARQPRGPSPGRTWPVRRGSGGGVRAVSSEPLWRPLRCLRRASSRLACGILGPLFTLGSCPLVCGPRGLACRRRRAGGEGACRDAPRPHHVTAQSRRDHGWAARQTGPPQDSDPGGGGGPPPIHDPIVVPSSRSPTPSAGSAGRLPPPSV